MSDKVEITHDEAARPAQSKFKRHCGRFWMIYLISFVIIAVLIVVLIIFVAVPKIIQNKLNDAQLLIDGIIVSAPEADSLTMSINSTILADGSVHATIQEFTGEMYLEDLPDHKPFASITFPEIHSADVLAVNVTEKLSIGDHMDALTTFNTWLISNKTVRVTVDGRTKVKLKGLSRWYGADFKKTIEFDGLDNFAGLEVTNATISITPDENGDNFVGFTNIPNRSLFTMDIGNATFTTSFEQEEVGFTVLDNMKLFPGDNLIDMRSAIDQLPILSALGRKPYCEGEPFAFDLVGINVTGNGQNLAYYGDALAQTQQTVLIPIKDIIERDLNITRACGSDD